MNKLLLAIVGGVVVVGAGAAIVVTRGGDDKTVKVTKQTTDQSQNVKTGSDAFIAVDACDVVTQAVAEQVLGAGATKGDTSAGNASSDDVSVSSCTYTIKTVTTGSALDQAKSAHSISVLARAARTKLGADSNKAVFGSQKPAGVQDVSGYGDKAYWNPAYGQLNVLKDNNWYILSNHTGLKPTESTLDEAKILANALQGNLK